MTRVLIVCLANTCRSPAAAAILRHMAAEIGADVEVDSCAVTGWSIGEPANPEMCKILVTRGIAVTHHRARRIQPHDFESFDYILGVSHDVVNQLHRLSGTPEQAQKVRLLADFSSQFKGQDIPDPFARDEMCAEVIDMMTDACQGFIDSSFHS